MTLKGVTEARPKGLPSAKRTAYRLALKGHRTRQAACSAARLHAGSYGANLGYTLCLLSTPLALWIAFPNSLDAFPLQEQNEAKEFFKVRATACAAVAVRVLARNRSKGRSSARALPERKATEFSGG